MEQLGMLDILAALGIGAGCAMLSMMLWIRANSETAVGKRALMREAEGSIAFLFDDEELVDATPQARTLMGHGDGQRTDWENFLSLLSARFPKLRSDCSDLASVGRKRIFANDNQRGWLEAEYWNGLARITLVQDRDNPDDIPDALVASAMEHELAALRSIGEDSPQLIWKRDTSGRLVWANRAYIELSEELHPPKIDGIRPWPPHDVFQDTAAPAGTAPIIDMHSIDIPNEDKPMWFEITSLRRGHETIHFAIDASAVVFAREAQRNFVQTLTNTFAQLSVGLAIFDVDRRLVLFNPAIVDLMGLPAEFLVGRPTLFAVLDRLRDQNMIPEPKNYSTWRDQVAALETAAQQGNYHETWPLSNGQTFRVTGKPHPNGAIAFLMEDISDDISLTRKFRSQIDTANAVIDNLGVSIAVFSPSGSMIMANRAYRQLWGAQAEGSLINRDFADEMRSWVAASAPSPVWHKLKDKMARGGRECSWREPLWLDSHVELTCHYAPLPNGNHQITFLPSSHDLDRQRATDPIDIHITSSALG